MRVLLVSYNNISDLDFLNELDKLEELAIGRILQSDLSPIFNLKNLKDLTISNNTWITEEDLKDMYKLEQLDVLDAGDCDIGSIDYLSNLNLKRLFLDNGGDRFGVGSNHISDVSPLREMNSLETFDIRKNVIEEYYDSISKNEVIVDIPEIFQQACNAEGIVYSDTGIELSNCEWNEFGKSVKIPMENEDSHYFQIFIKSGVAQDTKWKVFVRIIDSIELDESSISPNTFTRGEDINFENGSIIINYKNGQNETISITDPNVIIENYNPNQTGEQTVAINYKGATTELKINVEEGETEENYWQFLPYIIAKDSKNGYLENIKQGTTCKDIIDVAYTNGRVEIYKGDKLVEDLNEKLATGMIVKVIFTNEEYSYKIVVTGDTNGDADVDELDLLMLARYNAGYEKETQMVVNEYLRAANLYKDDDFGDVLDLLKLARILVNLDEF